MKTDRVFTVAEANAELVELRERLPRLREARLGLIASSERITDAVASDGGGIAGSDWFRHQETLKAEVGYLAERGILLRDPDTGLQHADILNVINDAPTDDLETAPLRITAETFQATSTSAYPRASRCGGCLRGRSRPASSLVRPTCGGTQSNPPP